MPAKKYLIVIGGPTACGKTKTAIKVANHFGIEIISADSRQFYREMNIGTAKPSYQELAQAPHHFINNLSIHDEYTAGDYERDVLPFLDKLYERHDAAIIVGGSGFFIQAVCEGLDEFPLVPKKVRNAVVAAFEKHGLAYLQNRMQLVDPAYYAEMDNKNPHRLIRALSVYDASGKPFSSFLNQEKKPRNFEPIYVCLEMPREHLYRRINKRVDKMMNMGLLAEAKTLYPHKDISALQTVGYSEFFDFFDNKTTLEEAIELVKRNSRRYAKRQTTWFKKRKDWNRFLTDDPADIIKFIQLKMMSDLEKES